MDVQAIREAIFAGYEKAGLAVAGLDYTLIDKITEQVDQLFKRSVTWLELVNQQCASDYDKPDHERYGYRFFFRPYIGAANDLSLIGVAIAWPYPQNHDGPFYYSVAGADGIGEYKRGECFEYQNKRDWGQVMSERNAQAFVDEKNRAMGLLLDYVRLARQLTAAHS